MQVLDEEKKKTPGRHYKWAGLVRYTWARAGSCCIDRSGGRGGANFLDGAKCLGRGFLAI